SPGSATRLAERLSSRPKRGTLVAATGGPVAKVKANGIEIEYETAGNTSDPALLLVMGLGAQLTIWPDSLVQGPAKRGFYVIRSEQRENRLSTGFDSWGLPDIPAALMKAVKGEKIDAP